MHHSFERVIQLAVLESGRTLRELQIRLHLRTGISLVRIRNVSGLSEEEIALLRHHLTKIVPSLLDDLKK
jgi:hypothetical protein